MTDKPVSGSGATPPGDAGPEKSENALVRSIDRLTEKLGLSPPVRRVARRVAAGFFGLFGLKLLNLGLLYITAVLQARILGPEEFGLYSFGLSWVNLLVIFALWGLGALTLRESVRGMERGEPGHALGILRFSVAFSFTVSLAIVAVVSAVLYLKPDLLADNLRIALLFGIWIVPFLAAMRIFASAVKAFHHTILAMTSEMLIRPGLFLIALLTALWLQSEMTYTNSLGWQIAVTAAAMLGCSLFYLKVRSPEVATARAHYDARIWIAAGSALLLVSSARVMSNSMDRIMLGLLATPADVGIYTVAARNAQVVALVMASLDIVFASFVAEQFARGDKKTTQSIVTLITRLAFAATLVGSVALYFLSPYILALFGKSFVDGQTVFGLLLLNKLTGTMFGSAGILLAMTGQERRAVASLWIGAILNISLNYLLIPRYGMTGAAISALVSGMWWKVALSLNSIRLLGIDPTIFGFLARVIPLSPKAAVWKGTDMRKKRTTDDLDDD